MKKFIVLFFISFNLVAGEPLSLIFDSKHDLDTTVERLQNSIKAANYRLYAPRKLLEDLTTKRDISGQVVVRFCNFEHMYQFLQIEKRLGIMLPCRITVIEDNNKQVKVVIENYKRSVAKFNNKQMSAGANILIDELTEVIEDALW